VPFSIIATAPAELLHKIQPLPSARIFSAMYCPPVQKWHKRIPVPGTLQARQDCPGYPLKSEAGEPLMTMSWSRISRPHRKLECFHAFCPSSATPSSLPVAVRHASATSIGIMLSRRRSDQAEELSRKRAWDREHVKYPFWFGGSASCFAACVTHPLDLGMEQRATHITYLLTTN
jgi:hypothetical protein